MNKSLKKIIDKIGGQRALARRCNVTQQHVYYWLHRRIPAERVLELEKISEGEVTRYDLRPDIYPREETISDKD